MASLLQLQDVSIAFRDARTGTEYRAINDFSFQMAEGEVVVIIGDSGSGKSTLLHFIAGLLRSRASRRFAFGSESGYIECSELRGSISIDGKPLDDLPPRDRPVGIMLQQHGVYDHLTVRSNLSLPLRLKGVPKSQQQAETARIAKLLHIDKYVDSHVASLSGGQQQRVALGKLLLRNPKLALLDEAFAHIDPLVEEQLTKHVLDQMSAANGSNLRGLLLVTHDVTQTAKADHIILFRRLDQSKASEIRVFSRTPPASALDMMVASADPLVRDWQALLRSVSKAGKP